MPKKDKQGRKFQGAHIRVDLVPYGHCIHFETWRGKDEDYGSGRSQNEYQECRDYGSDETGEQILAVIANIAAKDWKGARSALERAIKLEGG